MSDSPASAALLATCAARKVPVGSSSTNSAPTLWRVFSTPPSFSLGLPSHDDEESAGVPRSSRRNTHHSSRRRSRPHLAPRPPESNSPSGAIALFARDLSPSSIPRDGDLHAELLVREWSVATRSARRCRRMWSWSRGRAGHVDREPFGMLPASASNRDVKRQLLEQATLGGTGSVALGSAHVT